MEYSVSNGNGTIKIVERDLSGTGTRFWVGKNKARVNLKYDRCRRMSQFRCSLHGRVLCWHVRMIKKAMLERRGK